jgi:hypothetical protein
MQLTYDELDRVVVQDGGDVEDMRDIPFFGFLTGSLISLGLWGVIAWVIWAVVY